MPFRCFDPTNGREVQALQLDADRWRSLKEQNGREKHLHMPCCSAEVVLKTSKRGLRFFAHKRNFGCSTAPETEAHRVVKDIAFRVAQRNGWATSTEVRGKSPSGEEWIADVLAEKGKHRVAIEVQWSQQSEEETVRRQQRYDQSGVRCLWLFRQKKIPTSYELPAGRLIGTPDRSLMVGVPFAIGGQYAIPLEEYLDAAFARRLRFGIQLGLAAVVTVKAAPMDCWHQACGARTRIVSCIEIVVGPHQAEFSVSDLGEFGDLFETIRPHTPRNLGIGAIKRRYSKGWGKAYLSNGCVACDRLVGQHFEIHTRYEEEVVARFPVRVTPEWKQAMESRGDYGWGVYPACDLPS